MKKDDCLFCKLANGVIPTNSIYEDEDFNVIMDANPASKGHALILPKEHFDNLYEIEPEILGKAAKLAQKVVKHEKNVLKCDGYNLLQNNEEIAGQTIFHFHMHLIPRYKEESSEMLKFAKPNISSEEIETLCEEMKLV